MAPSTALNFFLIGVAVQFLTGYSRGARRAAEYLAVVVLALSGLVLLSHLYGIHMLYQFGTYSLMALPTSIAFIILSIGVLAAAGPGGWMAVAVNSSDSGRMLRSLWIPSICILPVLGGLSLLGERLGFYGTEFGLALMVALAIFLLTALAWRYAWSFDRTDAARRRTEAELPA
jgi:hypothetical protein